MKMLKRFRTYQNVWRERGAATLDHGLWLHWAVFGKYPSRRSKVIWSGAFFMVVSAAAGAQGSMAGALFFFAMAVWSLFLVYSPWADGE